MHTIKNKCRVLENSVKFGELLLNFPLAFLCVCFYNSLICNVVRREQGEEQMKQIEYYTLCNNKKHVSSVFAEQSNTLNTNWQTHNQFRCTLLLSTITTAIAQVSQSGSA